MSTERLAHVAQPAHQQTQQETVQIASMAGISYLEAGSKAAVPIVFLHGIGGAGRGFAAQVEAFGRDFRPIAWDMPGYGRSAPLPLVSMESLAAALAAFVRELGLERPVLVGHSIGGMVVQRLLAEAPDVARAAVLAQTSPAFGSRDPGWADRFIQERLGPLDAGKSMADLAPAAIAELVGDNPDPVGIALAEDCMAHVPDSTYRDMILAMPGFDQREALGRIAVPTLVLAGSRDRNAPAAGCERMASRIPRACYAVLEGVGHLANLEAPARFNAALREFLDGAGIR